MDYEFVSFGGKKLVPAIHSTLSTYAAEVSILHLWNVAESVRRGALTDSVINPAFNISKRKFDEYARSEGRQPDVNSPLDGNSGKLAHVFEWGHGTNPGIKLYDIYMTGHGKSRTISYKFRLSKTEVPQPDKMKKFYRRDHIFKEKATILENADSIRINPVESKFMVYWRPTDPKANKKTGIVFKKSTSFVQPAGGGKYDGAFAMEFIKWWTSDLGGGGDLNKAAELLSKNITFQSARTTSALNRIANIKARGSASAEAKKQADKTIKTIKAQMTEYGRRQIQ